MPALRLRAKRRVWGNKIRDVLNFLDKAFPSEKDAALRNRANIVSIFFLVSDLSSKGNIAGKEKEIGDFFRGFVQSIQRDLGKEPDDRDPALSSYQAAVTQGADKIKSIKIRHQILLDKLSMKNKFFSELICPGSPEDKYRKMYNKAKTKIASKSVYDFDLWLIEHKSLMDIKCPNARAKKETFIGHIRNCIHHPAHGTFTLKKLEKGMKVLKEVIDDVKSRR